MSNCLRQFTWICGSNVVKPETTIRLHSRVHTCCWQSKGQRWRSHRVGHFINALLWFIAQAMFLHGSATVEPVKPLETATDDMLNSCIPTTLKSGGAAFKLWSQTLRSLKSDLYKCSATAWIKYTLSPCRPNFLFFWKGAGSVDVLQLGTK